MVVVPNVVGKNRADATAALQAAGFAVKVEYPLIFGTFDRVHSQNPKAGTSLAKGSTVTIDVV
jgi:serine/threonine-protein kinase